MINTGMRVQLSRSQGGANLSAARDLSPVSYEPAPESKAALNMRVPKSLKQGLEAIVRIWKLRAEARGDDPTNIDITHVATALLKPAVASEFDQYGGRPKDDAAWEAVE